MTESETGKEVNRLLMFSASFDQNLLSDPAILPTLALYMQLYNAVDYRITKREDSDALPHHLLLLADENQQLIDSYVPLSQIYLLVMDGQVQGVYVLRLDEKTGEIMNLAVEPLYQGRGLGKALLNHAVQMAREQKLQRLVIKTGNSSIHQLKLYQQQGFDLMAVNYNYFLDAYPVPIWENRIQCKHQLVFELVFALG